MDANVLLSFLFVDFRHHDAMIILNACIDVMTRVINFKLMTRAINYNEMPVIKI